MSFLQKNVAKKLPWNRNWSHFLTQVDSDLTRQILHQQAYTNKTWA